MKRAISVISLAALTQLLACTSERLLDAPSRAAAVLPATETRGPDSGVRGFSEALAFVLRDRSLRDRLLSDLRQSPFAYQALPLRDYLESRSGAEFSRAMAIATRRSPEAFHQYLVEFEGYTLAMPSIRHRLSWKGDDQLEVAGTSRSRVELSGLGVTAIAYAVRGGSRIVDIGREDRGYPLLAIYRSDISFDAPTARRRSFLFERRARSFAETVARSGGGVGTNFVTCEDDPEQEGCGVGGYAPPDGPSVDLGAECDPGRFIYLTRELDTDNDGLSQGCEQEMALAFEPELLFEAQEPHSARDPHYIVEQINGEVHIGYLLSYYYDGGAVSHYGDSKFIVVHVRPWGTRWHITSITTSAHYGVSWGLDETRTLTWQNYLFVSAVRARIFVSRNHHGNYNSQARCNARIGDICSSAPADGGFAQVAGRGYNGVSGLRQDNNVGNTRRRLPIDALFRFGATAGAFTDCTYADDPARSGFECYLGTNTSYFAGWSNVAGATPYGDILQSLGFSDGFYW